MTEARKNLSHPACEQKAENETKISADPKQQPEKEQENKPDYFHHTKYLLKQYRRVAYAVHLSENELNLRMEMAYGTRLSTLEMNAELAGIDLSSTKLESYTRSVIRSKNMLEIIHHAINAVRSDPDHGELLYQVLYHTYCTPQKPKNREQILMELERKGFYMSLASYHNYLKAGIRAVDQLLWGYTTRDCMEMFNRFLVECEK